MATAAKKRVDVNKEEIHHITFPFVAPVPFVYRNGTLVDTRPGIYYSSPVLPFAAAIPEQQNLNLLLKVITPSDLKAVSPSPVKQYTSLDEYKIHLIMQNQKGGKVPKSKYVDNLE